MPSQTDNRKYMIGMDTGLELTDVSSHKEADVRFEAELCHGTIETPPEIEFRLTNTGFPRQFFFGAKPPFTAVLSEEGTLTLIPEGDGTYVGPVDPDGPERPAEFIPDSPNEGCWRALGTPLKVSIGKAIPLDRDETISVRYTVLVSADHDVACPPNGSHQVTSRFSIGTVQENVHEATATLHVG
ncbi:hypothetical protein [Natrialba hulunbeirensis]|nr:hypothetical protein [Natrialba hulunbeirensis]